MAELDEAALKKRQAWAERSGTQTYIQEMGAYAVARDEAIVRSMLGRGPGRLLDLPCGTGRFLEVEKELGYTVTAADYSPTMMSVAQQHAGVEFVTADAFNPPFAENAFDAILIMRLLFHYRNPEAIVGALARSLKPGGRMVFDTLNAFSTRWTASKVIGLVRRDPARRLHFETHASMTHKIEQVGLRVVQRRCAYLLPTRSYRNLPRPVTAIADALEHLTLPCMRVLTYWHVEKK